MRKYIFTILMCLLSTLPTGSLRAQWVQTNGPFASDVQALVVSGTNLFAGTAGRGVYLSTNNGTSWTAVGLTNENVTALAVSGANLFAGTGHGVYLSINNGTSWTAVSNGLTNANVWSLAVSGSNLFAGTRNAGVFLSTNNGTSWTSVGLTNETVTAFAVSGTNLFAGTGGGIFLSTNNGTSWAVVSSTDATSLAVSGTNLFAGTYGGGVFLSTNNGTSWTAVNSGLPGSRVHAFAVSGTNLFAGTDGGVFLSTNNGTSWSQVNTGLTSAYVYALAVSPASGGSGTNLFAGTSTGGVFLSTDNGTSWTQVNNGLTNTCPFDVRTLAVSSTNVFAGTWRGGIFLSTDSGTSWSQVNSGLTDGWVATIAVSGANLFAGTDLLCVFLSTNNGTSWTQRWGGHGPAVQALAVSGMNLFAGTSGGGVWLSTNSGMSWTQVSTGLPNSNSYNVNALAVSGTNLFAGTSVGVFLSTNNGTSWTQVNSGLTDSDVRALAVSGTNLFAGTSNGGVFLSTDNGMSWTQVNNGLTNSDVIAFAVCGTNLFAGTEGGGVFVSTNNGRSWTQDDSTPEGAAREVDALVVSGTNLFAGTNASVWRRPLSEMITGISTHLVTFQADMSALIGAGFNTSTDSIVVNGSFNGWNSAEKMTPSVGNPNIYVYKVPITATFGQNIEYKFRAFPDGKFNGGWETGSNRIYVFADQDTVLPVVQPSITVNSGWGSPIVTTNPATNIASASATVNGSVNPNGLSTTAYFEWGTSSTLATFTTTTAQSIGSGTGAVSTAVNLTGLNANTTYYFRVVGQNSAGTQRGSISSFTTLSVLNGSALFDGSSSRIRVGDGGAANPNAFRINGTALTVEAWIYPMAYPNPQLGNTIIARTLNTTYADPWSSYRLWVNYSNGNSLPAFSISAGTAGSTVTVQSLEGIPSFQWTHLAGTYDGTFLNIYVNGVLKAQINTSIAINSANGVGFYIGRYLTDAFEGAIDEVRLWNIPRSQSDIQASMHTQLIGNELGLVGYWNMNYSTNARMMPDQTANHNDLPVQGTTPIIAFNPSTPPGTPVFSSTPSSLDFGAVEQGVTSTRSLTITNSGSVPMLGIFELNSSNAQLSAGGVFFADAGQTVTTSLGLRPMISGSVSGNVLARTNGGVLTQIPYSIVSVALRQFDGNNISMWTLRDGRFAYNPLTGNAGLEWPKGSGKTAVAASGIWIAATVGGNLRTATAWYWSEFSPGPIVNGVAANPNDTTYRVYKIRAGDNVSTNADYASWPASLGAPVNPDGSPKIIGEQTLFSVYNDLNTNGRHFGTAPLGAEVQQTIFGYGQSGALSNSVMLRFRIINKSSTTWNNTYIGLWSDPDLGNAGDDLVGVDTMRNLGYDYNGSNVDTVYGTAPPAAGYQMLQGAYFTKPIQSFVYWDSPEVFPQSSPTTASQVLNFMQGKWADGSPYLDQTGRPTLFPFSGDPVTGTGSIDTGPFDNRMLLSTGPFDLEPGQSKEIIAAIILGKGVDYLNSITVVRSEADTIKSMYNSGQIFGGALENVATTVVPSGSAGTINDLAHSGAQIDLTAGAGGATVEVASYVGPPPGAQVITTPSVAGVGKYLDVQVQGTLQWPVDIRIYYTYNDLLQAGIVESDLQGLYYWSGATNTWKLYSSSGADDEGRGPSTTWVDTTNVTINGVSYEGFVEASAYHLTPMTIGAKKKTMKQRYDDATKYVLALPDKDFKKPAFVWRLALSAEISASYALEALLKWKKASEALASNVLTHLSIKGSSSKDIWLTDAVASASIARMVDDIIELLKRPQPSAQMQEIGPLAMDMESLPTDYGLSQNYPNPFNPSTTIRYQFPQAAQVSLKVYNALGQEVATLVSELQNPGYYQVQFTPQLPSGVYFYRLQAGSYVQTKKLVLLR